MADAWNQATHHFPNAPGRTGQTEWNFIVDFKPPATCILIVKIVTTLPVWPGVENLCKEVQDPWNMAIEALSQIHEPGHVNIIHDYFDNFEVNLEGKTPTRALEIVNQQNAKLTDAETAYDESTLDGRAQGAFITDTSITCECTPPPSPRGAVSPTATTANGIECNGQCVDPSSPDTCGTSCDDLKQCPPPSDGTATCTNGQCGQTCPTGTHLGTTSSGQACLPDCTGGQVNNPQTGTCKCTSNQTACGNPATCLDTNTDNNNCGSCGNDCSEAPNPSGSSCQSGSCQCPAGQTSCNDQCVDTNTDLNNCGSCGNVCATGASCSSGSCVCPSDKPNTCNNQCTNIQTDSSNCGACRYCKRESCLYWRPNMSIRYMSMSLRSSISKWSMYPVFFR